MGILVDIFNTQFGGKAYPRKHKMAIVFT